MIIGSVTLPLLPQRVVDSNQASTKEGDNPGTTPIIIIIGLKPRKITMEGYIYSMNTDKATLKSNYVLPLRQMVKTIIDVTSPNGEYDGEFFVEDFQCTESSEYPGAYQYRLLLTQGSRMIPLQAVEVPS